MKKSVLFCALLFGLSGFFPARAAEGVSPTISSISSGRLLLSDARLDRIRKLEQSDPLMAELLAKIRVAAEANLALPPNVHKATASNGMLNEARASASRILIAAFVFRLDGDKRFLELARRDLLNVASFPDWNPSHFLDLAETGFGVALGYNWLGADLSETDRKTIRAALVRNMLNLAPAIYDPAGKGGKNWSAFGSSPKTTNNWNFVCNAGFISAALVLRNEEPEFCRTVIEGARQSLPIAMRAYAPDGAWPESPTYWSYGTGYLVSALALMQDALGTDYNLSREPGFEQTVNYGIQIFGTSDIAFNFGDGGPMSAREGGVATMSWLAQRFGRPELMPELRRRLEKKLHAAPTAYERSLPPGSGGRGWVFDALYFPERQSAAGVSPALDAHFRGVADFVVMRGAANDPESPWVGVKGGTNGLSHGHLDLGSFIFDADGVRWALDLGSDDYNMPGYWDFTRGGRRWTYFRINNFSHNTLTPANLLQDSQATAPIVAFESAPQKAFAVVDLTAVYPGQAQKILRGVAMLNRSSVLIQDDLQKLAAKTPLTWRMMTAAQIELSSDGRIATLTQDGKKLQVNLLAPSNARFAIESAKPPTAGEKQNTSVRLLSFTVMPQPPDVRLAVLLMPVKGERSPVVPLALVPLSEWTVKN